MSLKTCHGSHASLSEAGLSIISDSQSPHSGWLSSFDMALHQELTSKDSIPFVETFQFDTAMHQEMTSNGNIPFVDTSQFDTALHQEMTSNGKT